LQRWAGGKAAIFAPYATVAAPVKAEDISHDKEVAAQYIADPLVKQYGSLRGISDMLDRGDALLASYYKTWPVDLPLLICHGTGDRVTNPACSQQYIDSIPAKDKTLTYFPGGFHELHNEPDGVKERLIDTTITWVEKRLPQKQSSEAKL